MTPKVHIKKDSSARSGYKWIFITSIDDYSWSSGIINDTVYSISSTAGINKKQINLLSYHYTLLDKFLVSLEILFRSKAYYSPEETKEFIEQSFQYDYTTEVEFEGF